MQPIETALRNYGYVRCPNQPTRWYAGGPGVKSPAGLAEAHIIFDLQHYPQGHIVVRDPWRQTALFEVAPEPVAEFDTAEQFFAWLETNGEERKPGANVWD